MADLIDREAAIRDLMAMPIGASIARRYNLDDWLRRQPSAREWVPVAERLPERDKTVLVTDYCGNIEMAWFDNDGWHAEYFTYDNGEVIAWAELPEPYSERRKD